LYFDAATVGAGVEVACDKVIGAAVGAAGAAAAGVAVGAALAAVEAFPALAGADVGTAGVPLLQALTTALAAAIAANWRNRRRSIAGDVVLETGLAFVTGLRTPTPRAS
jgi:hypothetical protein